jgi:hypothetical protein
VFCDWCSDPVKQTGGLTERGTGQVFGQHALRNPLDLCPRCMGRAALALVHEQRAAQGPRPRRG